MASTEDGYILQVDSTGYVFLRVTVSTDSFAAGTFCIFIS